MPDQSQPDPGSLKVEVDLGRIYADGEFGEVVGDRIIDAAAALLVRDAGEKVTTGLDAEIVKARDRIIDEKLEAIVTEALTKPIRQTDLFGTEKGEAPVTLNELVVQRFERFLKHAAAVDSSRPRYGGTPTVLEKMIDEAIGRSFKGEIKKAVDEATAQAQATVKAAAAEVLAEAISRSSARL